MTNILELLKNEKVEWKKLGEVIDYEQPTKYIVENTNYDDKYDIPVLTAGQTFILGYTKEKKGIYNATKSNPVIIFDDFTTSNHWVDFSFKIKSSAMKILKPKKGLITFRYCYHYIKTINIDVTEHKRMWISKFTNMKIPIPSLKTQEKIVEILDKFTNYVTELQSELQSRTNQYTYYRDKLLSEDYLNKITKEMKEDRRLSIVQLEEIVTIKNGKDWKTLGEGNIPVYGSGGEMGVFVDKYSYDKPTVLIPRKGSIDNVFYLDKPFWNVDTIFYTEIDDSKLIPKYFYYFIENYDLNKLSENSTRPSLTQSSLNKLKFPIPPLSLQNKIVKVLDKFQMLLADTKGLLPEEIQQRQKQYEYYREKLLTFDVECDSTHARTHIISNTYYESLREIARVIDLDIEDKVIKYQLSGIAGYSSQKISSEKLTVFNYVGVDNLLKDKYGKEDSKYVPQEGNFTKFTKDSILIGNIRPYLRKIWYADTIGGTNGDVLAIYVQEKNIVKSRYLYHVLADERFFEYNIKYSKGAKMPRGDKKKIMEYKFFLPPLHVQQHVVNILDKFDTLVNDIKKGLPKEIEQRQKQYEYWREQLLSFNL